MENARARGERSRYPVCNSRAAVPMYEEGGNRGKRQNERARERKGDRLAQNEDPYTVIHAENRFGRSAGR